ncbi:DUF5076 domain-containing protein [Altererythrobacter sp. MF3-039]|uniref:DUF5076 domain-containing protein n=1 Tax=Altererythrobacter sp. MF3-039 TaxID=3252901 RepID=UPI00390C49E1
MIFGKKSGWDGEIDVSSFDFLANASEFARLWNEEGEGLTAIIEPRGLAPDPFVFGMAMVDTIRHAAKAYAHAVQIPEEDALARIWEGFEAERDNPTDTPQQIDPDSGEAI